MRLIHYAKFEIRFEVAPRSRACDIERNCPDRGGYSAICTYSHITKAHCIPGLYSLLRSFYASLLYVRIDRGTRKTSLRTVAGIIGLVATPDPARRQWLLPTAYLNAHRRLPL